MSDSKSSPVFSAIAAAVAVASLGFNIVQYVRSQADKELEAEHAQADSQKRLQQERERSAPEAWFAYGTEEMVRDLFRRDGYAIDNDRVVVAEVPPFTDAMRQSVKTGVRSAQPQRLVAAFVVVQNVATNSVHQVELLSGESRPISLATVNLLRPREYLFVPVDFVGMKDARTEPDLPSLVTVKYQDGQPVAVRPSATRVALLGSKLSRALIEPKEAALDTSN